jgi:HK97 family phage major capsid protein
VLHRRLLNQGGAGGGSGVDIPTTEMATRGAIEKGFTAVRDRFTKMEERYGKLENFDPQDFANLRKQVEDLVAAQAAWSKSEQEKRVGKSDLSGGDDAFLTRVAGLSMPFVPDKELEGMSREYFNIIGYNPDELTYAATAAHDRLAGMSPTIQTHLRSGRQPFDSFERQVRELQGLNDAMYLLDVLMCNGNAQYRSLGNAGQRMSSLKLWKRWDEKCTMFQRAISGGGTPASGTGGGAWLPQMFSSQMHDLMQLETQLWGLFPSLDMPGKIYTSPVLAQDGTAYLIAENPSSQGAAGGVGGAGVEITESTPQTTNMTLTAVKLAARMFTSGEAEEDLLVPVIPFLLTQLAKVTARALDDATLNGDVTGTHMDASAAANAPTTATDRRKAWMGLRASVIQNSGMPNVDITGNDAAAFLSMKSAMGIYGVRPTEGVWICSIAGLFKLMQASDGANKLFLRYDMMGTTETVARTGNLGMMFGSPVILSEFCPDDTSARRATRRRSWCTPTPARGSVGSGARSRSSGARSGTSNSTRRCWSARIVLPCRRGTRSRRVPTPSPLRAATTSPRSAASRALDSPVIEGPVSTRTRRGNPRHEEGAADMSNVFLKWTGHETVYDADEVRGLSIAAKPGDIIEVAPKCAKRLSADQKWVEQERVVEEVETKRGFRTVVSFRDREKAKA